ncbi:hypothetical protein [Xanthomonas vasicola]|uniref:hypothetical protein n=1 Tax=Xanthomonas vasicola TaxID=56459 RepID=UPI000345FA26|nr:hypothetical protein [Xanthomonas vasicola]
MKTFAGAHCVHLALALVVAWQATSGWAVVPASIVFWLCIALVAAGIDRVFASHPAEVQATHSASGDTGDGNLAAQVIVRLPRLDAAAKRGIEKTVHDALVRQWRRHIVDVTPYEEERYPRQGICTTVELFLRAGDRLVLAFHPDANASPLHQRGAVTYGLPALRIRSGWTCLLMARWTCR